MTTEEEIEFYGLDGSDPSVEAEGFIAAIKKSAFKERKQRDNDWLCDYTATCLRGEALRWFAKLEMGQPEVVENWKLTQNAILMHYPRPTEESGEKSSVLVPTPAAARSSSSSTGTPSVDSEAQQEQRIRVLNEDGELLGYLGRAGHLLPDYWQGCLDAACDEEDAFRVIVKPCTDGTKLSRRARINGLAFSGRSLSAHELLSRFLKRIKTEV